MKRKFTVTGTVLLIAEYTLALTVYDNNLEQVASTSTTLKVVSNTINLGKSILTIGDSLTNEKPWLAEVRSLSSDLLTFVGTRGTTTNIKHEGRSGFSAGSYLTATAYTYENEGIHPFWDAENSRFNWKYYKTNTGINPDIIMIYLGTNGMALDTTLNSNNIKKMV